MNLYCWFMGNLINTRKDLQKNTPTFWSGVMALFGIFNTSDFTETTSPKSDIDAMRRDWEAIGNDMRRVMTKCNDGVWHRRS